MNIAGFNTSLLYEDNVMLEIFISGCKHNCQGCYNPELHDFNYGTNLSIEQVVEEIKRRSKFIDGIVFTGGDPLFSGVDVFGLICAVKALFPNFKLWLYTGFTREEISCNRTMKDIFSMCDVVITDRFDKTLPRTKLTGSNNQRIWRKPHTDTWKI